ncbi:RNA-binding S4 domain-containing protein [Desulfomarina sp.]
MQYTKMSENPVVIIVKKMPIRLGQFLKFADLVQDGVEAKIVILEGEVKVNGSIEIRRGRKLFPKDTVAFRDQIMVLLSES